MAGGPVRADAQAGGGDNGVSQRGLAVGSVLQDVDWYCKEELSELGLIREARTEEVAELIGLTLDSTLGNCRMRSDQVMEI